MAGTAVTPAPAAAMEVDAAPITNNNNDSTANNSLTVSEVNLFRITTCIERLDVHIRAAPKNDPVEFFNLCLALARGIDFAVSNKDVPSSTGMLPFILKQVCRLRSDSFLQAALLVLMISIKNACQNRWFSDQDSKELCSLANEILTSFCTTMDFNTEPNSFLPAISSILSRYYPRMEMGEILAFLEIKPGYGTYVHDFQISKDTKSSQEKRVRLLVAQMDNKETSSCLITPTQGNFLLNGKGVNRRHNVAMDTGPQMPTIISSLLKYGTNLLQAVGQFNGNYIVVIAIMSMVSAPDPSALQDYVQPNLSMVDSDSEIIEGPSRISVNCPISFKRINVPVKGHMCKHLQCFDYENYMEINSRKPSWRCPHCNQHVCFTDIRIDQNMVKVLKEVGNAVNDVIISSDGSWKAIMESDDHRDKRGKINTCSQNETAHPKTSCDAQNGVLDLTIDDYEMDTLCETQDRKVSSTNSQNQANVPNTTANSNMNARNEIDQNVAPQIDDDFWSGIYLSTYGSGESSFRSEHQPNLNNFLSPVLTDANTPALNQEAGSFLGNALVATSVPLDEISSQNSLQLQQFQSGNATISNEHGRFTSIPSHIIREPVAVQALPVQSPTSALEQRPRNNVNTLIQNSPSIAQPSGTLPGRDVLTAGPSSIESQQQISRTNSNQHHGLRMASSRFYQYPGTQTVGVQAPSHVQSSPRNSSVLPTELQNSSQQPVLNMRIGVNQSPGLMRPPASFSQSAYHGGSQPIAGQATGIVGSQQARAMAAAQRATQMARPVQTSRAASPYINRPVGGQKESSGGGILPPVPRAADVSTAFPEEQNWRPTGRMRGSLVGRAYSDAFKQFIIQPTQQPTGARPVSNANSHPLPASSQIEILMANRAALAQAGNYPYIGSASSSGGSDVLSKQG